MRQHVHVNRSHAGALACALFLLAALPAGAQVKTEPLMPSQKVSPAILVARINADCAVFADAIKTERPTVLAASGSASWRVVDPTKLRDVEHVQTSAWTVQMWKEAGNYVWFHSARYDSRGNERATQLCFRADGTLARVRQGRTSADFDTAAEGQAYFNTDGSLIRADGLFETNDAAIYKRVKDAPFMKLVI